MPAMQTTPISPVALVPTVHWQENGQSCSPWLDSARKALDQVVAHAYGWSDYTADMPNEEID